MKKNEIRVKGIYLAKVSGKLVPVQVDEITEREGVTLRHSQTWIPPTRYKASIRYHVTNLVTNRKTVFRAATKFRRELTPAEVDRLIKPKGLCTCGLGNDDRGLGHASNCPVIASGGPITGVNRGGPCTDLDSKGDS